MNRKIALVNKKVMSLTKEQQKQLSVYRDKWLEIGLSMERVNRDTANFVSDFYYKKILGKSKVPVVMMSSPYYAWLAVCLFSDSRVMNQVENQVFNQVRNQVSNQVKNQVENQVSNQVRNQVLNQVWNQVRNQVRNQVFNQVRNQVSNQVKNQVENQVSNQVRNRVSNQVKNQVENQVSNQVRNQVFNQVDSFVLPFIEGHLLSSYLSFYDYVFSVLDVSCPVVDKWNWYLKTSEIGLFYPLEDVCIISDRPSKIFMKNGRLHNENGMSVKYIDGFGVYSLNGVVMESKYVLTSSDEISVEDVLAEKHVDQRRELIRKIGKDRLINAGKIIEEDTNIMNKPSFWSKDDFFGYKLIDMSPVFSGVDYAPHLLMSNPSVSGTYHLEGVSRECRTIEQALHMRKPKDVQKIPVSHGGECWYQQGDVVIWPENAITLKPYPTILT